jgi:hypothetical protein
MYLLDFFPSRPEKAEKELWAYRAARPDRPTPHQKYPATKSAGDH